MKKYLGPLLVLLMLGLTTACDDSEDGEAEGEEAAAEAPVAIYEMETFLTNINDPGHHARLNVKLAVAPDTKVEEMKADALLEARIRDQVLGLLTAKTYDELKKPEGKERFREEIKEKLAPLMASAEIKEVLFSDFIVQ